jgi:AbrB family looped-hinge helix DNA binding protein
MRSAIDRAGRVVIPKAIRDRAGFRPDVPLEVRLEEGRVVIEAAPEPVRLVRKGRWTVAVAEGAVPALTQQEVDATLGELRGGDGGEGR